MKIKPYIESVKGINAFFETDDNIETESFFLENVEKTWKSDQPFLKGNYKHRSIITVGPEALLFLQANPPDKSITKVFTMVSEPSKLIPQNDKSFCGLFLSIKTKDQITWIKNTLPGIKALGILYDLKHNNEYVSRAQEIGFDLGIKIEPLIVRSKDEVPELLRKSWDSINGLLLIPDPTVISASLVKYIIKDGISHSVPVIGYNRFFLQSGSLMAFVYDYQQIGFNAAKMVKNLLFENSECQSKASEYKVLINNNIVKHLNFDVSGILKDMDNELK